MNRLVVVLVVLTATLAAAPAAVAHRVAARRGDVSVSFSYTGGFASARDGALRIARAGRVLYDGRVSSRWCGSRCSPMSFPGHRSFLHVVPLSPSGALDVVLDLYTGGAHCCSVEQVLSYDARRGTYVKHERNFGDPGARLADLNHDGRYEFLTADDSFAYAFTDFAASGMPIEIQDFPGRFRGVTSDYPQLIARDAAVWMRAFTSQAPRYADTTGVVAAWAADEDRVGNSSQVAAFLSGQARAGHLRSGLYPRLRGWRFIRVLDRFLHRHGYL